MAVLKAFFDLLEHSASENRFYGRKWLKSSLFGLQLVRQTDQASPTGPTEKNRKLAKKWAILTTV